MRTGELLRFGLVGATSTIIYALCAYGLMVSVGLSAATASLVAYLMAVPVSFAGQKYFTFKSRTRAPAEFVLFTATHLFGLLCSTAIAAVCAALSPNPVFCILAVVAVVPGLSFLTMKTIVFSQRANQS